MQKVRDGIRVVDFEVDKKSFTSAQLSVTEANKEVFSENMEAIERVGLLSKDKNIKAATDDVMDLLAEKYMGVYISAIRSEIVESGMDFAIGKLASKCGYATVVVAVRDLMNVLLGTKQDLQQMYRILCYSDMCAVYSCIMSMQAEVSMDGVFYYCKGNRVNQFIKYATNLAQLRVLGEKEYFAYLMGDGWLTKRIEMSEETKSNIEIRIYTVRKCAEILNLQLSPVLKYELR